LIWKAADAALTAQLGPELSVGEHLRQMFRLSTSRYQRIASVVHLADRIRPGTARRLGDSLLRTQRLPFRVQELPLIGCGTGATVFRLGADPGEYVLKVDRRSLGRGLEHLMLRARRAHRRYAEVRSWFAHDPNMIVPTSYLILHAPLLGLSAMAAVQPFIRGMRRDLLRTHSDDELFELFEEDPAFRSQIECLARRTLDTYEQEGRCLDLLGPENLLLITEPLSPRLALIDFGFFKVGNPDVGQAFAHDQERIAKMEPILARLRSILERIHRQDSARTK
jgi:hypothetical protein